MGEDTRIENTLMHTYANPLAVFFMAKQMVKWLTQRRQQRNSQSGEKITVTTELQRLLMSPKIQLNKLFKL